MHVQTSCFFIKKRLLIFFMVDLASYYFQLSESLYYFKKNFDYTVMIKGNCWYANYWTEAKYLGAWRSVCIDSLWKFYWDIPLFASDKRRKGVTYRISVHTQCKRYRMVPSLENVGLGKFGIWSLGISGSLNIDSYRIVSESRILMFWFLESRKSTQRFLTSTKTGVLQASNILKQLMNEAEYLTEELWRSRTGCYRSKP